MMKKVILVLINILVNLHVLDTYKIAKLKFYYKMKKWPDFDNPKDLNEKINWLKFHDSNERKLWTILADKYEVRNYIQNLGLGKILVKLYGKWDKVEDSDFDSLPNKFVMKENAGSGDVFICHDKRRLEVENIKNYFKKILNEPFGILSGEMHYKD